MYHSLISHTTGQVSLRVIIGIPVKIGTQFRRFFLEILENCAIILTRTENMEPYLRASSRLYPLEALRFLWGTAIYLYSYSKTAWKIYTDIFHVGIIITFSVFELIVPHCHRKHRKLQRALSAIFRGIKKTCHKKRTPVPVKSISDVGSNPELQLYAETLWHQRFIPCTT